MRHTPHTGDKEISLEFEDFKDGVAVEKLLGFDFVKTPELLATLNFKFFHGVAGVYSGPMEGSYPSEPAEIDSSSLDVPDPNDKAKSIDLWEHLTKAKQDSLDSVMTEYADEHERDSEGGYDDYDD